MGRRATQRREREADRRDLDVRRIEPGGIEAPAACQPGRIETCISSAGGIETGGRGSVRAEAVTRRMR